MCHLLLRAARCVESSPEPARKSPSQHIWALLVRTPSPMPKTRPPTSSARASATASALVRARESDPRRACSLETMSVMPGVLSKGRVEGWGRQKSHHGVMVAIHWRRHSFVCLFVRSFVRHAAAVNSDCASRSHSALRPERHGRLAAAGSWRLACKQARAMNVRVAPWDGCARADKEWRSVGPVGQHPPCHAKETASKIHTCKQLGRAGHRPLIWSTLRARYQMIPYAKTITFSRPKLDFKPRRGLAKQPHLPSMHPTC